jgi:predicted transcriptional regulator with HTH domain
MTDLDSKMVYDLLIAFSSYTELKRKILVCLAHIYPQAVSGSQLSMLIGYSGQARTLYRGVLDRLKADNVILLDKLTSKLYSIRINHEHPLMKLLVEISQENGLEIKANYLALLQSGESDE